MIAPYQKPRPRPTVAWLVSHEAALHEDGSLYRLEQLEDVQIWAGFAHVNDLLRDCHGEAVCWDGKPIRWSARPGSGDFNVRVLHVSYPEQPQAALAGIIAWRNWLCGYGAAPGGSLGGSGLSLVKATLEHPLWTAVGELPPVRFVLGGRQELGPQGAPAVYRGPLAHLDMRAAYAKALGELRYGGRWLRAGARYPLELEQAGKLLFINAQVEIPEAELGPLPERPRSERGLFAALLNPVVYPTARTLQGTWTIEELDEAEAAGCKIKRVLEIWLHTPGYHERPFAPWWEAIQQGRELAGFGGVLAKATGNATWGMFAVRRHGRRQLLRRSREPGGRSVREWSAPLPARGNPSLRAPDLAESITGRVRAELHRGMRLAGEQLICAHTDGLWAFEGVAVPGWRRKLSGRELRLLNPQAFAWTDKDGTVEYVVAGVPAWRAEEHFERAWAEQEDERAGRPHALGGAVAAEPIPLVVRGRRRRLAVAS